MTATSMALPVDIQWERLCVSEDMTAERACASDKPAKWQSSIAVFKYVPGDDYQTYPDRKITYIKVVCTICGYQPKDDEVQGIISSLGGISTTPFTQDELEKKLASYRPCNEAIVQITVAPPRRQQQLIPLNQYPYFMDFQPKKRELFEIGTDTNEFMSRSLDSLNIKKSSGTTQSQEVLDIDQGFNVSAQGSYAGTGGGFSYGQQGQWGTKQIGTGESGLARTTDESHERRETTSHSTQISQLWHLLDSYHLGTNRVVFFVQPRPHVLQDPSGFVGNAPRPIEGIQEFFLIVNQPKDQADFCLDVRLDTGHLYERPIMDYDYKTDTTSLPFTNLAPLSTDTDTVADGQASGVSPSGAYHDEISVNPCGLWGGNCDVWLWKYDATVMYDCFKRSSSSSTTYSSPYSGYVIDVNNLGGQANNVNGFQVLSSTSVSGQASYSVSTTPDGALLTISIQATSRACFKGSVTEMNIVPVVNVGLTAALALLDPTGVSASILISGAPAISTYEAVRTAALYAGAPNAINQVTSSADVQVEVFLRSTDKIIDTGKVEKIFFVTTRLLCCCPEGVSQVGGIVFESLSPLLPSGQGASKEGKPVPPTGGEMTLKESEMLRNAMRQEMLRNLVSSRRTSPRTLAETQMATDVILPIIVRNPSVRATLSQPSIDALPEDLLTKLSKPMRETLKHVTRIGLLSASVPTLMNASGLDAATVHQLRAAVLAKPVTSPGQTPPRA